MSLPPSATLLAVGIAVIFVVAAALYWFLSGYLDPAGTVLLVFVGGSAAFGFGVLLRATALDR